MKINIKNNAVLPEGEYAAMWNGGFFFFGGDPSGFTVCLHSICDIWVIY